MTSLKEQLLAAIKPGIKATTLNGVQVYIKHFSEAEKFAHYLDNEKAREQGPDKYVRARLVASGLCDADRNPLFGPDELDTVLGFDADAIEVLYGEIVEFNKDVSEKEADAVARQAEEEAKKANDGKESVSISEAKKN